MKRLAVSGYFLIVLSALGFSFKAILVKTAYGYGVDPITLMLMRVFISLPFFITTLFLVEGKSALKVTVRNLLLFAFMGIVGIGCAMLFSFYSIEVIDASLATLVVFTYPAMTMVILLFFLKERATTSKIVSLIVTFFGLTLVIRIDRIDFLAVNEKGIIFGLIAAFCFALYNTLNERALKDVSPIRLTSYCMVFLVGFFAFFFGNRPYPDSLEVWGIAALLGIFAGFMPFLSFSYGVKKIGAGRAVIISSLGPVFTVLWAYFFLGERLDIVQISGMAMIVVGVTQKPREVCDRVIRVDT